MYIIRETALMMGFTFVVGIAFAYVLKGMTFFFSRFGGCGLSDWMGRSRVWARAYRMNLIRTYRSIWSTALRKGRRRTDWPNTISEIPGTGRNRMRK